MSQLPPLPFRFSSVPRTRQKMSAKLIRDLVQRDRPVIIPNSLENWPVFRNTVQLKDDAEKIQYFESLIGNRRILFTETSGASAIPFMKYRRQHFLATFSGFVDHVRAQKDTRTVNYAESLPLKGFPEMSPKRLGGFGAESGSRVWIGFGGQVTNLHHDGSRNMMRMIAGVKRVTLFPPEMLPYLYPAPIDRGVAVAPTSCVRLLKPNFKKHPLLRRALKEVVVAVLKPGDSLYVPPFLVAPC